MHVLAGLDTPTGGAVMIEGTELAELDDGELTSLRRDKLGFRVPVLQPAARPYG